ncbi:MAG: hypothetical protein JW395_0969 [Nitrospira sp.]|nr:hypothetical protein [Nitrospira sp.]
MALGSFLHLIHEAKSCAKYDVVLLTPQILERLQGAGAFGDVLNYRHIKLVRHRLLQFDLDSMMCLVPALSGIDHGIINKGYLQLLDLGFNWRRRSFDWRCRSFGCGRGGLRGLADRAR